MHDKSDIMKDKIVEQVIDKFNQRSEVGIKKYGTTLEQNNSDDFLNHLQEELMDSILYIQKLKSIEISDTVIEDAAIDSWFSSPYDNSEEYRHGWIDAIQWYKKQIK